MILPTILHFLAQIPPPPSSVPQVTADGSEVQKLLQIVFATAGAVCVIVVTLGGLNYVFSSGDPQKVGRAKNMILYALIGLAVAVSAFSIVTFVIGKLFS